MQDELILEKYVTTPVELRLVDGVLQCAGVVIANDAKYFDAVTDKNGVVHGIYVDFGQKLVYFNMVKGVPEVKIVARNLLADAKAFIGEEDGVLHMLVVGGSKISQIDHFYTSGKNWVKSNSLFVGNEASFISSCPCKHGKFALLVANGEALTLWWSKNSTWKQKKIYGIDVDSEWISIASCGEDVEIFYPENNDIKMQTAELLENEQNSCVEDDMANGNMLNSKYIMQITENTRKLEMHSEQIESLRVALIECEKISKQMSSVKEAIKLYENQINQLNIRLQELVNRFNGVVRAAGKG